MKKITFIIAVLVGVAFGNEVVIAKSMFLHKNDKDKSAFKYKW